jgi:hypothetical protein
MIGSTDFTHHPFDDCCRLFKVHYTRLDLTYAQAQGRIFDNVWPSQLPAEHGCSDWQAAYTYVITTTGHVTYGRCFDEWQVGVKHLVLARERPVVAAGELSVVKDSKNRTCVVTVNLDSGRYMRNLFGRGDQDEDTLQALVTMFFIKDRGATRVQFNGRRPRLTPDCSPSTDEYERLLACATFCEQNAALASQVAAHLEQEKKKKLEGNSSVFF